MSLPVNISTLTQAIDNTVSRIAIDTSGKDYLKMDKGGFWVYGRDDVEVEEKSLWAINPNSFSLGFIAWDNGTVTGEEMRLITEPPIHESQLPTVQGNWEQQVAMQLVCISGEDKGTQVIYKASSKGGRGAFNELLKAIMDTLRLNQGTDKVVPVIQLAVNFYKHEKYGKIYTPVFNIVDWATMDATVDHSEPEPAAIPEPEPEPEPTPAPRRRRRA